MNFSLWPLENIWFITWKVPRWCSGKESACQYKRHRFNPWVVNIPWSRTWQHTPVFLPEKFHGWRSLVSSSWGALEKEMATYSSILAWRIPGTGEPDGLLSMGSHRVGHDWSDLAAIYYIVASTFLFSYVYKASFTDWGNNNVVLQVDRQPCRTFQEE